MTSHPSSDLDKNKPGLLNRASAPSFHPVMHIPKDAEVLDFTQGRDAWATSTSTWTIGRYNEHRPGLYNQPLFAGKRTIHMGIDIGAPVGTPVFAFTDGHVCCATYHASQGDYGHTLITRHLVNGKTLWALFGHLSMQSIDGMSAGKAIERGSQIGSLGAPSENGGWPPHLHFQLSIRPPTDCNLPGVVAPEDLARALLDYPDPQLVLGTLY